MKFEGRFPFPFRHATARQLLRCGMLGAAAMLQLAATPPSPPRASRGQLTLAVLTFNVWHGLIGEKGGWKLYGEEPERKRRRFALQIEEIRRLDPDLVLLQEVNPAPREARRYARALGYDQIHKVANCGLHLGPLKIPRNVNEGLAILARPELHLRRAGSKRLSGNAVCADGMGFETRESRFALFGEITAGGRRLLVATTHLSPPPLVAVDFEASLGRLAEEAVLTAEQRQEILAALASKRARQLREVRTLLGALERRRRSSPPGSPLGGVLLGGDFNATPGSPPISVIEAAGFSSATPKPLITWDPVTNRDNQRIGAKSTPALPTFGVPEVEALLTERESEPRQIDHVFTAGASQGIGVIAARRVLDEGRDGLLPSDHFGILVTVSLDGVSLD